jgi:hypothetical protein
MDGRRHASATIAAWLKMRLSNFIRSLGGPSQRSRSPPAIIGLDPYVDGPLLARVLQCFDQIACAHMSGLFVRSHMNAGQDGFRDKSSKQQGGLIEGHWVYRSVSCRGSIDHTICSLSCKFWHRLSTVAVKLLPVSG